MESKYQFISLVGTVQSIKTDINSEDIDQKKVMYFEVNPDPDPDPELSSGLETSNNHGTPLEPIQKLSNKSESGSSKTKSISQLYLCQCDLILPLEKHDRVFGIGIFSRGSQLTRPVFKFMEPPFFQLNKDRAALLDYFEIVFNSQSPTSQYQCKKMSRRQIEEFYQFIFDTSQDVDEYLSFLAYQWIRSGATHITNFLERKLPAGPAKKLLYWWNEHRNIRRLQLLSLTKLEIRNCKEYFEKTNHDGKTNLYQVIYNIARQDPYKLIPISLAKAEQVLIQQDRHPNPLDRRLGQLARILYSFNKRGWTGCPIITFKRWIAQLIEKDPYIQGNIEGDTAELNDINYLFEKLFDEYHTIIDINCLTVYLPYQHYIEYGSYLQLKKLIRSKSIISIPETQITFEHPHLTQEQQLAIIGCLQNNISVITGGPGTGKSTIIREILINLVNNGQRPILLAPTGKAVSRLREVLVNSIPSNRTDLLIEHPKGESKHNKQTVEKQEDKTLLKNIKPSTIHMLLRKYPEIVPSRGAFFTDVIIDETSMVMTELFYQLITRFHFRFRLILVGDINQLPPIEWGSFFEQLILSDRVPIFRLCQVHRIENCVGSTDQILLNSKLILDGDPRLVNGSNFNLILYPSNSNSNGPNSSIAHTTNSSNNLNRYKEKSCDECEVRSLQTIEQITTSARQQGVLSSQITIITPYRRDVRKLNELYQRVYFPANECTTNLTIEKPTYSLDAQGKIVLSTSHQGLSLRKTVETSVTYFEDNYVHQEKVKFVVGDRVMMRENNYAINLFNGDEGIVKDISADPAGIVVQFKDGIDRFFSFHRNGFSGNQKVFYQEGQGEVNINLLIHAFALTVHRCQGSEWPYVILYLPPAYNKQGKIDEFVTRNMIYTAITRARRAVWIIGDPLQLRLGICRATPLRCDNLARRLTLKFPRYLESDPENSSSVSETTLQPTQTGQTNQVRKEDDCGEIDIDAIYSKWDQQDDNYPDYID